jgi:hypothetical protein
MNRKIGLILILGGLFLVTAGCGESKNSNYTINIADTNESLAAKNTIKAYFEAYFLAQADLKYSKMSSEILVDNENTQLNESLREIILGGKRFFGTGINQDYQYQINYRKVTINGSEATIGVTVDLDFQYRNASPDIKSGLYGINYDFCLKYDGAKWLITNIDSDLVEYQNFTKQVREQIAKNPAASKVEAIRQVTQTLKNNMSLMLNSTYHNGTATSGGTVLSVGPGSTPTDSVHTKSIYVGCKSYTYNPAAAAEYALTYAEANLNNRIFYTIYYDCTNFISQCVWAGYVGFSANAIATAKYNIANKYGMIYSEWHAGTGGGTGTWEEVNKLWNYLTDTTKNAGPIGVGFNNGGRYDNIIPNSINIGDVLQVRDGPGTVFEHSVFVTKKSAVVSSFSDIFISSHTNNRKNFSLQEIINLTGGYSCYMRGVRPQSGYMK